MPVPLDHANKTFAAVVRMRKAQRDAARTGDPAHLERAREIEQEVDRLLRELIEAPFKRAPGTMDVPATPQGDAQ